MTMTDERDEGGGRSRWQWVRDAFSMEPDHRALTEDEVALLDRIAEFVVRRGLITPALLLLESVKPLNYVGSQAMAFFEPVVRTLFTGSDYSRLQKILERRESLEVLMQRIEKADAEREARREARRAPREGEPEAEHASEAPAQAGADPDDEHDR
jgi:hypothetical protein